MDWPVILFAIAFAFAAIEVVKTKAQALLPWAVLLLTLGLLWHRL
jgi:hypothetical protein